MTDTIKTNLPTPDLEEIVVDMSKEKIGKIIEPEICIGDNTQTNDGIICYV